MSMRNLSFENSERMLILAQYIQDNYMRRLTLAKLAQYSNINETYISELFKRELGLGYAEYLAHIRIRRARELLQHTNEKISVIGRMVGYHREPSFRRAFRRKMQMSPAQYRQRIDDAYFTDFTDSAAESISLGSER